MKNINVNNDFEKICKILDENNTTYIIYSDTENLFSYTIYARLFVDNKESSMQIIFNNNYNIFALSFINDDYESRIKHYQYLIDCKEIKMVKIHTSEKIVHYSLYIDKILDFIYKPKRHSFEFTDRLDLQINEEFKKYLSDDNIRYKEKYYSDANIYTTFNRYGIPIEIAYLNNNLYEVTILSKDNINKNEIGLEYKIGTDIPCIIISSLINYILKVNN